MDQIYTKKVFQVENKTSSPRTTSVFVVNVNSTVVFKHFEDSKDLTVLNIFKEKLAMSCLLGSFYLKFVSYNFKNLFKPLYKYTVPWLVKSWLNFDLNFICKFLCNFAGELKKLKLVMVMVKCFDKYHHLFNHPILVTILLFLDWDSIILNIKVL